MRQGKPSGDTLIMINSEDESLFHAIRFCESIGLKQAAGMCRLATEEFVPIYAQAGSLRIHWEHLQRIVPFRTLVYVAPSNPAAWNPTHMRSPTCLPPNSLARAMHDSVEQLDQTVQLLLERLQKDELRMIAVVAPHKGKYRREIIEGFLGLLQEIRRVHGLQTYLMCPARRPPNPRYWIGQFLSSVW